MRQRLPSGGGEEVLRGALLVQRDVGLGVGLSRRKGNAKKKKKKKKTGKKNEEEKIKNEKKKKRIKKSNQTKNEN